MAVKGFFSSSELVSKAPTPTIPRCGVCQLAKKCKTPKIGAQGKGRRGILIVGRPPNAAEDHSGKLGGGKSGFDLQKALGRSGVSLQDDCWIMGALACWAGRREIPTAEQLEHCRPTVVNFIKANKPKVIILLGPEAVTSVIHAAWKPGGHQLNTFTGFQIPSMKYNAWICPMDHPDYIFNSEKNPNQRVTEKLWAESLRKALQLKSRPWPAEGPPDLEGAVECIVDTRQAAQLLKSLGKKGGPIAFDYETNCLRPMLPKARIVSASVCFQGERTIAFPMDGPAILALANLLKSPCPKIAANLKFEDQWSRIKLKVTPRNWIWDTMLAAHWLDSREGITGLKIQSFLHLGMPAWNESVEPFLKNEGESPYNNIHRIGLPDLLRYNGLDSLIEYRLAAMQIEAGGVAKHLPLL